MIARGEAPGSRVRVRRPEGARLIPDVFFVPLQTGFPQECPELVLERQGGVVLLLIVYVAQNYVLLPHSDRKHPVSGLPGKLRP
jgi:hypothetical protein